MHSVQHRLVFSPKPGNSLGRAGVLPTYRLRSSPASVGLIERVNRTSCAESVNQLHTNALIQHDTSMHARTTLFLAFALILTLFGMLAVEQMMEAAAAVFEVVPKK